MTIFGCLGNKPFVIITIIKIGDFFPVAASTCQTLYRLLAKLRVTHETFQLAQLTEEKCTNK